MKIISHKTQLEINNNLSNLKYQLKVLQNKINISNNLNFKI